MINNVVLVGRLTKDPEMRRTQSGAAVCSFTLAVNRKVQAQGQPDTDFINCVAWNKTAELMVDYLHKGSLIGVEGRIQTRNYDNQQGQKVYITEVVVQKLTFLDPKKQGDSEYYQDKATSDPYSANVHGAYAEKPKQKSDVYPNQSYYQAPSQSGTGNVMDDLDIASDDLPF